jgi:hypothetical protein
MKMGTETRHDVFVSYSHEDAEWLKRLQTHLKPYVRGGKMNPWDDTRLVPGQDWQAEIKRALTSAKVAILLVSPSFLASDFIATNELPCLLDAAAKEGLVILWLPVSASAFDVTELRRYQALSDPATPLDSLPTAQQNRILVGAAKRVVAALEPPAVAQHGPQVPVVP